MKNRSFWADQHLSYGRVRFIYIDWCTRFQEVNSKQQKWIFGSFLGCCPAPLETKAVCLKSSVSDVLNAALKIASRTEWIRTNWIIIMMICKNINITRQKPVSKQVARIWRRRLLWKPCLGTRNCSRKFNKTS